MTDDAVSSFLKSVTLGIELNEAWILCSATAYIWNYNNHVLDQNRHREIVDTLQTLLDGLRKVGHAG